MKKTLLLVISIFLMMNVSIVSADTPTKNMAVEKVVKSLQKISSLSPSLIERGVMQAAALWTAEDGSPETFQQFCETNFCKTLEEKTTLFVRLCDNFEVINGYNNRISIELQRPQQLIGYASTSVDQAFSAYSGLSHFQEDMFDSKLAFVVILNFPHFTLSEKQNNGDKWSDLEWGFVRLGDVFTSRIPAEITQNIANVAAAANTFIDNYNIDLERVGSFNNRFFWNTSLPLISHWGLRDELKASYADKKHGVEKQAVIYDVMKRIIQNEVPDEVIKQDKSYKWYPSTNQLMLNGIQILSEEKNNNNRYQYLLDFFKAERAADAYGTTNFIQRKFDDEYEISVEDAQKIFEELMTSPQVSQVAEIIAKRLGRKLQPFDIWYDGFKSRSGVDQAELDNIVKSKYPTKEAFESDLLNILVKLGFTPEKAQFICQHVAVDASLGAGHAWGTQMRNDKSVLRTRVGEGGMDYKGYNIGVHEFGHNVEQTISMHDVPNYFMSGVPNTAFTEALAFIFQGKDLELMNIQTPADNLEDLNTLDLFWGCYEIMGVSMVDIRVWQWMYDHPNANVQEVQDAVIDIAKQVWNQYYAPVFKVKDEPILAIYSHMIVDPLYLSAYPIGHLIDFQLESFLANKNLGSEVCRMFKQGRVTPELWMKRAVGASLSAQPLLLQVKESVNSISKSKEKKTTKK